MPANRKLSPDMKQQALAMKAAGRSRLEIVDATGLTYQQLDNLLTRSKDAIAEVETREEALTLERPVTVDEVIARFKVDLTLWEVDRFQVNKWEVGAKVSDGDITYKDGRASGVISKQGVVVKPLYQVKVWFKRIAGTLVTMQKLKDSLISDLRKLPKPATVRSLASKREPYLFEFSPFDLHMGKYAWGEETVTDYDVDTAEDLFNASLDFLLAKALRTSGGSLDRILCVFGNDVMHVDSKRGQTTGGTQMDFDSRYIRVFRRCVAVHRRAVDILRQVAPVDVKIVPGNHDEHAAFHVGEVLATRYEGVKHVAIDNAPTMRKYYDYGVNLFGFTHGDKEKVQELPLLMARERPELWARCSSREWHIGHKHVSEKHSWREQDLYSDKGVRVRRLTSLSAHDAWHTNGAYTDRRACESFLFHREAGFTDHSSFNVDHFTGKPMVPKLGTGRAA
jgi:hypothetical protein